MAKKFQFKDSSKKTKGKVAWSRDEEKKEVKGIRLNRYIAHSGVCSRREADKLIAEGKIRVNNKVVTEMGFQVRPGDRVHHGSRLLKKEAHAYVLLNKPKDFITTTKDPKERKTVMDLVRKAADVRLYPVGRLDRNTTGLLLLTNDGELADKLSHPSNNIKKIYKAELNKPLQKQDYEAIAAGIKLEDGPIKVDEIAVLTADNLSVGIEIHSGKNRIVRRIFEHFGYEVIRLDRVVYAGLDKSNLPRGKWRHLTEREVGLLQKKGKARG
jgi:23S rRNA pseudouridine2605 synthase